MKHAFLSLLCFCTFCVGLAFLSNAALAEDSPYLEIDEKDPTIHCSTAVFSNVSIQLCLVAPDDEAPSAFSLIVGGTAYPERLKKSFRGQYKTTIDCKVLLTSGQSYDSKCRIDPVLPDETRFFVFLPKDLSIVAEYDIDKVFIDGLMLSMSEPPVLNIRTAGLLDYLAAPLLSNVPLTPYRNRILSPYAVSLQDLLQYPLGGKQVPAVGQWKGSAQDWERMLSGMPNIAKMYSFLQKTMPDWHCEQKDDVILCEYVTGCNLMFDGYIIRHLIIAKAPDVPNTRYQFTYAYHDSSLTMESAMARMQRYAAQLRQLGYQLEINTHEDPKIIQISAANPTGYVGFIYSDANKAVALTHGPIVGGSAPAPAPASAQAPMPMPAPAPAPAQAPVPAAPAPAPAQAAPAPASDNPFDMQLPPEALSEVCVELMKVLSPYECDLFDDPQKKQKCTNLMGIGAPYFWNELFKSVMFCDGDALSKSIHTPNELINAIERRIQQHPLFQRFGADAFYATKDYYYDMLKTQTRQCAYDETRKKFTLMHPAQALVSLDPTVPVTPQNIDAHRDRFVSVSDWFELVYISNILMYMAEQGRQTQYPDFHRDEIKRKSLLGQAKGIVMHGRVE